MAQELAGDSAGTSSDAGRSLNADVNMLNPITGQGHALPGGKQSTPTLHGVSTLLTCGTWSYNKRNVLQASILFMALTGAVLGTQHLITKMRYLSGADHHSPELVLQADMQQVISHATTDTYRLPQIFQVGGSNAVWKVPATPDFFTGWASGISFRMGDMLRITGGLPAEWILQVPDANYAACTATTYLAYWNFRSGVDTHIQLTEVITYNFIQNDAVECLQGLKFSATVNPITVPAAPPRPNVNAPIRQPRVFEVGGDTATWTIPSTTTFYDNWANNISFLVGDVLSFTLSDSTFEVVEVPYKSFERCTSTGWLWFAIASKTYQLTAPGIKYFVAYVPQNCIQGMRFSVNIYEPGSTVTPAPPPLSVTPNGTSPTSSPSGTSPTSSPSGTSPKSLPSGSSPPTPQSPTLDVTSKPKTSIAAIVGGICGGVFGIAAVAGLSTYLCKHCSFNCLKIYNFHGPQTTAQLSPKPSEEDLMSKPNR